MKKHKSQNRGFSLIELIVVIAVMAVLLGVLVPTLVRNIEKSRHQTDLSNISEVLRAFELMIAIEPYAYMSGTVTYKGGEFKIEEGNASADLGDKITEGKTLNDFFREAVRSLAGDNSATYTLKYTSKLNSSDTELVFTFGGEKVTAVITSSKYGKEDIS